MYLRHSKVRKDGKTHTYWRLVRSVRRSGKVIQETVAQLGELDAEGRAKAKALAREITGRGHQRELFESSDLDDAPVAVCLKQLRVERGRGYGFPLGARSARWFQNFKCRSADGDVRVVRIGFFEDFAFER